jgi:hypothetical protein
VSDAPNITQLGPRDRSGAERRKRFRKRKRDAAVTVTANLTAPIAVTPAPRVTRNGTDLAAFRAALALTSTSGYFGIVGMTAIYHGGRRRRNGDHDRAGGFKARCGHVVGAQLADGAVTAPLAAGRYGPGVDGGDDHRLGRILGAGARYPFRL